jgi:broad specificity phosphatase PhoE
MARGMSLYGEGSRSRRIHPVIYLARHGQTEFNVARRYQGQGDSPLTARGQLQARRMGERLAHLIPDFTGWRLAASPLGRARQTAEIIAETLGGRLAVELDPRLAEVSMGEWDGLTFEEVEARRPRHVEHCERHFHGPGGETFEALAGRLGDWLAEAGAQGRVIAVSHGVSGRVLRGLYTGLPRTRMLRLDAPQDALHLLDSGKVRRIPCEPVEA